MQQGERSASVRGAVQWPSGVLTPRNGAVAQAGGTEGS